ncbi:MAG: hypothetical protein PHU25_21555 [Deltaproteobacteria bacterium]|nr:hypothetical protein [Deltaproteobacteria bacterium]
MLRLRRWLGTAGSKGAIKECAAEALAACLKEALRQRAFLHVLGGEFETAAELLASAPGLGWSGEDHPGHLLFAVFAKLLNDQGEDLSSVANQTLVRVDTYRDDPLYPRIVRAVAAILGRGKVVAPVDVLVGMSILGPALL